MYIDDFVRAVTKDLRDNRDMIKRNQSAIIFLLAVNLGTLITIIIFLGTRHG